MSAIAQLLISQKIAGGGGGGSPAFTDAIASTRADSVATLSSGTGGNGLNPTGSNRAVIGFIHTNEFGTQATHNDMDLGAQSLDQLGSTEAFSAGFNSASAWQAIAPSTGEQALSGDVSAAQAAMMIGGISFENVNQTTPFTLGTVATGNFTTTSGTASASITATAGQIIGMIVVARDSNAGPVTFAGQAGSTLRYTTGGVTFETSGGAMLTAVAGTTGTNTIEALLSVPAADNVDWLVFPFTVNPV